MSKVTVRCPAKLNLSLDIVGILPNGYHSLDMIMQTISLYDIVTIEKDPSIIVELPGSHIAADHSNTAYKAALRFFDAAGICGGARITVNKNIPSQAGMAGGSADAAGVLIGLNALYNEPLSFSRLLSIGAKIGADVPFSLMGGTCRVQGIGDVIKALPPCPECAFVVIMPPYGVSTPEAFARFDTMTDAFHPETAKMEEAIINSDLNRMCAFTGNSLQPCSGTEKTQELCSTLMGHGADTALMTGSGAAVFGIFKDLSSAKLAASEIHTPECSIFITQPDQFGAKIV